MQRSVRRLGLPGRAHREIAQMLKLMGQTAAEPRVGHGRIVIDDDPPVRRRLAFGLEALAKVVEGFASCAERHAIGIVAEVSRQRAQLPAFARELCRTRRPMGVVGVVGDAPVEIRVSVGDMLPPAPAVRLNGGQVIDLHAGQHAGMGPQAGHHRRHHPPPEPALDGIDLLEDERRGIIFPRDQQSDARGLGAVGGGDELAGGRGADFDEAGPVRAGLDEETQRAKIGGGVIGQRGDVRPRRSPARASEQKIPKTHAGPPAPVLGRFRPGL
ncbi:hypothetical protein [Methylocystis echinoides]|uniref:hypothetical protein n=1 Tax=Methylocystis echinoides TaxID=29468 RepID=UPI00249312E3|nr:hypothetical protein [Methylocystis echinoides]